MPLWLSNAPDITLQPQVPKEPALRTDDGQAFAELAHQYMREQPSPGDLARASLRSFVGYGVVAGF